VTSTSIPSPPSQNAHKLATGTLIAIILVAALFGILLICLLAYLVWRRRRERRRRLDKAATHPRLDSINFTHNSLSPLSSPFPWMTSPNDASRGGSIITGGAQADSRLVTNMSPSSSKSSSPHRTPVNRAGTTSHTRGLSLDGTPPRRRWDGVTTPSGSPLKSASNSIFFASRVDNRTTRSPSTLPSRPRSRTVGRRGSDIVAHRSVRSMSTNTSLYEKTTSGAG